MEAKDLETLKSLAEAATPGPWEAVSCAICLPECNNEQKILGGFYDYDDEENDRFAFGYNNTQFVAAANPAVVLNLIAEVERLNALVDLWKRDYETFVDECAQLDREAEWLAEKLSLLSYTCDCMANDGIEIKESWNAVKWREAAHKAVEENNG